MTKSFNKKQIGLAVACRLALGVLSSAARAQDVQAQTAKDRAFVADTRNQVIKSGFACAGIAVLARPRRPAPNATPITSLRRAPGVKPAAVAPPAQVAALTPPVTRARGREADPGRRYLFDFDKATLRPAGRDTLDTFIGKLRDISPETIMAIGHADRIGTERYNQRLSEQRVASVKAYMVSQGCRAQPRICRRQGRIAAGRQSRGLRRPEERESHRLPAARSPRRYRSDRHQDRPLVNQPG